MKFLERVKLAPELQSQLPDITEMATPRLTDAFASAMEGVLRFSTGKHLLVEHKENDATHIKQCLELLLKYKERCPSLFRELEEFVDDLRNRHSSLFQEFVTLSTEEVVMKILVMILVYHEAAEFLAGDVSKDDADLMKRKKEIKELEHSYFESFVLLFFSEKDRELIKFLYFLFENPSRVGETPNILSLFLHVIDAIDGNLTALGYRIIPRAGMAEGGFSDKDLALQVSSSLFYVLKYADPLLNSVSHRASRREIIALVRDHMSLFKVAGFTKQVKKSSSLITKMAGEGQLNVSPFFADQQEIEAVA